MSKLHYQVPTGPTSTPISVRLGSGTGANGLTAFDEGKLVKFVADSRYDLCAAGDAIHGLIVAVEIATSGGYAVGSVNKKDTFYATADGLQATPGTGTIAVGDFVVCGSVTAKGTQLPGYPKVCKATVQLGAVPADLTAAAAQTVYSLNAWKVVSVLTGAGAVGDTLVIERVGG